MIRRQAPSTQPPDAAEPCGNTGDQELARLAADYLDLWQTNLARWSIDAPPVLHARMGVAHRADD